MHPITTLLFVPVLPGTLNLVAVAVWLTITALAIGAWRERR